MCVCEYIVYIFKNYFILNKLYFTAGLKIQNTLSNFPFILNFNQRISILWQMYVWMNWNGILNFSKTKLSVLYPIVCQ